MIGGGGSDNFIFTKSEDSLGTDWVYDFGLDDTLTFSGFEIAGFDALMDLAIQDGNNISIEYGDDECLNLKDCQLDSLQSDMMIFI
jgi:Ca2+-binding RTX toxin-like protein